MREEKEEVIRKVLKNRRPIAIDIIRRYILLIPVIISFDDTYSSLVI